MMPLLPLAVSGQSLHISRGTTLALSGGVDLVLNNIALVNDGAITPAKSTILFTGNAPVSVAGLGGTANTSLNNVTINKAPGTEMQLNGDVSINSNLSMLRGNLQLNGPVHHGHHLQPGKGSDGRSV